MDKQIDVQKLGNQTERDYAFFGCPDCEVHFIIGKGEYEGRQTIFCENDECTFFLLSDLRDLEVSGPREYRKFEFCMYMNCPYISRGALLFCDRPRGETHGEHGGCIKSATEFHDWLKDNGFKLLKGIEL